MVNILVLDDEKKIGRTIEIILTSAGHKVRTVSDPLKALEIVGEKNNDILISDLKMPEMDGFQVLERSREIDPDIVVVIMTAFATVDTAVKAIKKGAFDYLVKPFEARDIRAVVERATRFISVRAERDSLLQELSAGLETSPLLGKSQAMKEVMDKLSRVADTDASVLITGESGTGKELAAYTLHNMSSRADKPFISINCTAIPESLIEAELFGHEKGAYTGAHSKRIGKFELADKGTVLLDEIGDMKPELQSKLLRFLQERKLQRVGGNETIEVDVRVLAATNQDLESLIKQGGFREDLYYRLAVIPVHLPPLRERKDDIPLLALHFLEEYSKKHRRTGFDLDEEAVKALKGYSWPGNVRELSNLLERAVLLGTLELSGSGIDKLSQPLSSDGSSDHKQVGGDFKSDANSSESDNSMDTLDEMERKHVIKAMEIADGNKKKAAELLGVNRTTLYRMLGKYKL